MNIRHNTRKRTFENDANQWQNLWFSNLKTFIKTRWNTWAIVRTSTHWPMTNLKKNHFLSLEFSSIFPQAFNVVKIWGRMPIIFNFWRKEILYFKHWKPTDTRDEERDTHISFSLTFFILLSSYLSFSSSLSLSLSHSLSFSLSLSMGVRRGVQGGGSCPPPPPGSPKPAKNSMF